MNGRLTKLAYWTLLPAAIVGLLVVTFMLAQPASRWEHFRLGGADYRIALPLMTKVALRQPDRIVFEEQTKVLRSLSLATTTPQVGASMPQEMVLANGAVFKYEVEALPGGGATLGGHLQFGIRALSVECRDHGVANAKADWCVPYLAQLAFSTIRRGHDPAALQRIDVTLDGARYHILMPARSSVTQSDRNSCARISPPLTRTLRFLELCATPPARFGSQRTTLANGAAVTYDIDYDIGGGSGGTEGELTGSVELGTRVLGLTCHDQGEWGPSPSWCLDYLIYLEAGPH